MTSRLRLLESNVCPPDKFRYRFEEDGHWIRSFSKDAWLAAIRKHAVDNGYEIPTQEEVEDQLCRSLNGEWCQYADGAPVKEGINARFTINDIVNGTRVFISFAAAGAPLVSQEEAEARALVCSRCFLNTDVPGCGTCHQLANLVTEACGARKTESDALLKACSWCKCSAQANVWMPTTISGVGVTDHMLDLAPSWCWKANSIREARRVSVDSE